MRLYHHIINTQPFTCHRPEHTKNNVAPERFLTVPNKWGYDVHIKKAHMWMSSYLGAVPQDLYAVFAVMEPWDENAVISTSWDHYTETATQHELVMDFGDDYILWKKDQDARLRYYGLNFANWPRGQTGPNGAHIIVNIWFGIPAWE